jgi:GLPGLI family protein
MTIGMQKFLIPDTAVCEWQITKTQKTIAGYKCQLAQSYYKGRYWNVWFTNEIPVSDGPWKLRGLPGLVLEAIDSTQQISFSFMSLSYQRKEIKRAEEQEKITRKEYKRLLQAYADDPLAFLANQYGANFSLGDFTGGSIDPSSQPRRKLLFPNNPIEPY